MLTSNHFRNLRAGPVVQAGRMNDATVRGLVAKHGLRLGDRDARDAGNPRYDLADAARLFVLHILMKKIGMAASAAVMAVNEAYDQLKLIAERELEAIDTGEAPDCPRYLLSFSAMSIDTDTRPDVMLHSDPRAVADRQSKRGGWCNVQMELREIVRQVRNEMANSFGYSIRSLRHDFSDAPEQVERD